MRTQLEVRQRVRLRTPGKMVFLEGIVLSLTLVEIEIGFPEREMAPEELPIPGRVIFRYWDYAGVHTAETEVLRITSGRRASVVLRPPYQYETQQKRRYFRQACSLPTTLQVLSFPQPRHSALSDPDAIIEDLSAGGARIRTRLCLPIDDIIALSLRRPLDFAETSGSPSIQAPFLKTPAPELLDLKARVVRIRADTFGDFPSYSVGAEFILLCEEERNRMAAFVFHLQKAHGRLG